MSPLPGPVNALGQSNRPSASVYINGGRTLVRKVSARFHAHDLHLVLGPTKNGKPIRFKVTLDGTASGDDHGTDTDASGAGAVRGHRLYQLIRQKGAVEDRTFEIEFLDPGVQAFAFTFG